MPCNDSIELLEAQAREVKLGWGVVVQSFCDPRHSQREGAPEPVRRWRVRLPEWFPTGSWLHGEHSFASLAEALTALDESGALEAVDALWHAQSAQSAARNAAFSKLMSAHCRRDRSYDELLRERHAATRASVDPLPGEQP